MSGIFYNYGLFDFTPKGRKTQLASRKSFRNGGCCGTDGSYPFDLTQDYERGETMADIFWKDYWEKLFLLEKAIGHKVDYRILEPFRVPRTIVGIQAAARKIAEFVGLDDFLFIVAVRSLTEEAAHIELEHQSKEVFIEISEKLVSNSRPAILAALSHEICHKFLYHHSLGITGKHRNYENEVLTDITAVYLGLGKLMLNGCQFNEVNENNGVRETIKHKIGYLSGLQIAAVYNLVCEMRNIDRNIVEANLSAEALATVQAVAREFGHIYDDSFHQLDFAEQVTRKVQSSVKETQESLARAGAMIDFLRVQVLKPYELAIRQAHRGIFNILEKGSEKRDIEYNPALRYLRHLKADMEYGLTIEELASIGDRSAEVNNTIMSMLRSLSVEALTPSDEQNLKLRCPLDGTPIEHQVSAGDIAICPTCRYSFPIAPSIGEEITKALKSERPRRRHTWLEKIKRG
jgi:hypothetical protein